MGELILVGTIHSDGKATERIENILENIHPDIVSLEFSSELLQSSQRNPEVYSKFIAEIKARRASASYIQFVELLINKFGYENLEYMGAKRYSNKHRIPLYLSDDPTVVPRILGMLESELRDLMEKFPIYKDLPLSPEQILRQIVESVNEKYEVIQFVLSGRFPQERIDAILDEYRPVMIGQRDRYMEQQIRQIIANHPDARLVHIVGAFHLLPDSKGDTLYSRLQDQQPQRRLLYEPVHDSPIFSQVNKWLSK